MICPCCERREPDEPQVCDPCRSWLGFVLREIPELCAEVASLGFVERDGRATCKCGCGGHGVYTCRCAGRHGCRCGRDGSKHMHFDPAANVLVSGPVPSRRSTARVSGTRVRGVPRRLDLTVRADTRTVTDRLLDQTGDVSAATILRGWVLSWWEDGFKPRGEGKPRDRSGTGSVRWLTDRLEWACDHYDGIDALAAELRELHNALRQACGLTEPQPELCVGVPCKTCGLRTLYRLPGSLWVECDPEQRYGGCQALLSEEEMHGWVALNAGHLCGTKHVDDQGRSWWCALLRHHDGDCEPHRKEEAA